MGPSTPSSELRLFVGDLLRRPGSRRDVDQRVHVTGMSAGLVTVGDTDEVRCEFALESMADGLVVHGVASATWSAECARCLEAFSGTTSVPVDELFEPSPTEGDTYPLLGEEIDIDQLLRDTLVTEFPMAPHPPSDAAGKCIVCGRRPEDFPFAVDDDEPDARWSALDVLRPADEPDEISSNLQDH